MASCLPAIDLGRPPASGACTGAEANVMAADDELIGINAD
jgi:hypothetical protein